MRRIPRKAKTTTHFLVLLGICASLAIDGAKTADWLFVVLSVAIEIEEFV